MPNELEDIGLKLLCASTAVGVVTSSIPGSLGFQFSVAVLGPLLMIGLTALVPPLVLRPTVEPAAELGVGGT